jgi:1-acyl-sn-glycerol-3-phosphate acyltransferase
MQFFNFIFLARSWASDRQQLATHLAFLGREAEKEGNPLCFMLYPEGTLVSKNTRPQSKKFADKMGIVRHLLRSTRFTKDLVYTKLVRHEELATAKIHRPPL